MSYSDDNDLLAELSIEQLALLSGDENGLVVDTTRTAQARLMGDSQIDATLRGRFDYESSPTDNLLKSISIDFTIYYLNEYRYRDSIVPPGAIRRKDNALRLLQKIAEGHLSLDGFTSGNNSPSTIISNINKKDRYFDDNTMDLYFNG